MAAIPRDLIESELFGHEKGAFTGANSRSAGRFEQAEGGTLFLDEIGDMPMEAQTRLLRVLQQGEYTTVGGRTPIKSDVRIIAATNKDLRLLIQQGLFREDLFFRLNVVPLRLPPLRERAEDIPDLIRHFFAQAQREGLPPKQIDQAGLSGSSITWPGNVRELENLARRLAALYPQETIGAAVIERNCRSRGADGWKRAAGRGKPRQLRWSVISPSILPSSRTVCRRQGSTIGSCGKSNSRCCQRRLPPPAATRSGLPTSWVSTGIRCARRSAISIFRCTGAAAEPAYGFRK